MASKKAKAAKKAVDETINDNTLTVDPYYLTQEIFKYIFEKYPDIKVSELELAQAWMFLDVDSNINIIAPEVQTEPIKNTIDRVLFILQGTNNTLVRFLNNIALILQAIEEFKKDHPEAS